MTMTSLSNMMELIQLLNDAIDKGELIQNKLDNGEYAKTEYSEAIKKKMTEFQKNLLNAKEKLINLKEHKSVSDRIDKLLESLKNNGIR